VTPLAAARSAKAEIPLLRLCRHKSCRVLSTFKLDTFDNLCRDLGATKTRSIVKTCRQHLKDTVSPACRLHVAHDLHGVWK